MRPFTDFLRDYRNGKAVDLLSSEFAALNDAVSETNQKGSLTIKIKVGPAKGGGSERDVHIAVTSSIPRPELPSAVFFADDEGNLHRSDPQQREMFSEAGNRAAAARD